MYLGCRFYPFVYVEFSRIPLKKLAYIYCHVPSTVKLGLKVLSPGRWYFRINP
jgi:hypothetical protein